jgi:carboxymethylenebutenolidase
VYGPRSPITSRDACEAAGGVFYPGVFGWMVHVTFVGSDDPRIVWNGAMPPNPDLPKDHDTDRKQPVQVAVAPPAPPATAPYAAPVPAREPTPRDVPATQPAPAMVANESPPPGPPHPPIRNAGPPGIQSALPAAAPSPSPATAAAPSDDRPSPTVFAPSERTSKTFMSGHRDITYDRFMPAGGGSHAAIILLHGDGGLPPQEDRFEEFAANLAKHDYVVEIVHYFDRTGTIAASAPDKLAHFREWEGTVRDAVTDLAHAPGVDSTRIGIFGTGVGASLALSLGAHDSRIRAVAEYEGSLPVWAAATVRRMPAVFIGESEADPPAAVLEANRVRAICQAANAPVDLEIYAAQKNRGRGSGIKDLRQRTLEFLEQHLKEKP